MTIVVGYVPTPRGRAAVDAAVEQARLHGSPLLVVNAYRGDAYVDSAVAGESDLADLRSRLTDLGVTFEIRQPTGRDPAESLLALSADQSTDLLVIGLRHRSPVGKLILGSTAQRLLLEAPCPVLAVKAHR